MSLLSVDEIIQNLLATTQILPSEMIALQKAGARTISSPVIAKTTNPPFAASAMDGYAIHTEDTKQVPAQLKLIGELAAGHNINMTVHRGEAARIFTGAALPAGADAVIMQEYTQKTKDGFIDILATTIPQKNIRPSGEDFFKNQVILSPGQILTPAALALAAAAGFDLLPVIVKPRIAIFSTGDELVTPGSVPGANQIIASNSFSIAELARLHGADIIDFGIIPDNKEALTHAVEQAIKQKVDILISTGSVADGDYDFLPEILHQFGMIVDFHKIAMRPGKPTLSGRLPTDRPMRVFAFPGNPVSCLTVAYLLLVPILEKMSARSYKPPIFNATVETAIEANGPLRHYMRALAKWEYSPDKTTNELFITPFSNQGSSILSIMTEANCFLIHEADAPALKKGSNCRILLFDPKIFFSQIFEKSHFKNQSIPT